jgi:hypothetical protein
MAYTSKYGFIYQRHLMPGIETPATLEVPLTGSLAFTIGDLVAIDSGYLVPQDSTAESSLGILVGLVTKNGENLFKTKDSVTGTKSGDDTYSSGATNATVDKVRGVVYVDPWALFFAYTDSAITQAACGLYFAGKVNNGTAVDGVTGTGATYSAGNYPFQLIELVTILNDGTASTTTGLFRLCASQVGLDPTQTT